jgi:hypothetical protein
VYSTTKRLIGQCLGEKSISKFEKLKAFLCPFVSLLSSKPIAFHCFVKVWFHAFTNSCWNLDGFLRISGGRSRRLVAAARHEWPRIFG